MDPDYQYFNAKGRLVRVQPSSHPQLGSKFVYWNDLKSSFPGMVRVQDGETIVTFLRNEHEYRYKPLRLEHMPGVVLDIIYADPKDNIPLRPTVTATSHVTIHANPITSTNTDTASSSVSALSSGEIVVQEETKTSALSSALEHEKDEGKKEKQEQDHHGQDKMAADSREATALKEEQTSLTEKNDAAGKLKSGSAKKVSATSQDTLSGPVTAASAAAANTVSVDATNTLSSSLPPAASSSSVKLLASEVGILADYVLAIIEERDSRCHDPKASAQRTLGKLREILMAPGKTAKILPKEVRMRIPDLSGESLVGVFLAYGSLLPNQSLQDILVQIAHERIHPSLAVKSTTSQAPISNLAPALKNLAPHGPQLLSHTATPPLIHVPMVGTFPGSSNSTGDASLGEPLPMARDPNEEELSWMELKYENSLGFYTLAPTKDYHTMEVYYDATVDKYLVRPREALVAAPVENNNQRKVGGSNASGKNKAGSGAKSEGVNQSKNRTMAIK